MSLHTFKNQLAKGSTLLKVALFLLTLATFSACDDKSLDDYYFDYEGQKKIDEEVIRKYFRTNNVDTTQVVRTATGLYYLKTKEGTGPQAEMGKFVDVKYIGRLTNGQKFDSSYDRGDVFSFQVGAGRVIKGWDEGLQLMKEGEEATLFIPSHLGYGPQGSYPTIPPSAVLVFEIELVKVR
ncbi:FKBP-type peptidyl-prolyl cis-trans isomerase [Pontibacter ruber]|uniref:Peptidyl-prolyl cis-trans isomerase n=1 Tax=Pontibacter ruber TaxID=1343895 RepID=A0ABW5CWB5_9BACT|nr:FKBP-type peptidyl-prolyl cis-trans isomerase [Pontibacter ruber]